MQIDFNNVFVILYVLSPSLGQGSLGSGPGITPRGRLDFVESFMRRLARFSGRDSTILVG